MKLVNRAALVLAVLLATTAFLFVSFAPAVEVQSRPSAKDIQAARQVWQQLKSGQGGAAIKVRLNDRMISGLSALARDGSGLERLKVDLSRDEIRAFISFELPFGMWLNSSASATGSHLGFPVFRVSIGRLTLPAAAGRPLANMVRWALQANGADLPPLDEMVESFAVDGGFVQSQVKLPLRTGVVNGVIAARSSAVNQELVNTILCRISSEQRASPVDSMSQLTRRAFAGAQETDAEIYPRAAFAALSLAVVGRRAEFLLSPGAVKRDGCSFPGDDIRLQGRADLAKHWALSAALTAVLGRDAAESLGEWKELDDSRPGGSGFSFVDLAADRAGVQVATAALERKTALATQERLRGATEDYMLPPALLKGAEGLSEETFIKQFGSLDRRNYKQAVLMIDALLAEKVLQQPPVRY